MKKILTAVLIINILCVGLSFSAFAKEDETVMNVYTISPYYEDLASRDVSSKIALPEGVANEAEFATKAGENVASNLEYCQYISDFQYHNKTIEPEVFEKMGPNQIIIWVGHGTYMEETGDSILWIKSDFDVERYNTDEQYKDDCDNERLIEKEWQMCLTAKYIEKYCGDLTNSIVYLGPCDSAHEGNDALAKAFLDKGAAAVIGNTYAIQMRYGDIMQYATISFMSEINPNTGKLYTVGEALDKAKSIYGKNDKEAEGDFANGAEPILFGNKDYRLELPNKVPQTGDQNNVIVYIIIAALMITIIVAVIIIMRKNKRK